MKNDYKKREMSEKERDFWADYAVKVNNNRIFERSAEWTIRYAQQFVYGLDGRKLRSVDATYLDNYLDELGRKSGAG